MRISILTPTYNAAQTISYCLDSFCEQSWGDKELILLDGESDDCTVEIAETYKNDGVKIFSKADKGMYYALNSGLVLFSGDAVGVLNSDDAFADKIALEVIANGLTTADIVYGGINFISDHMSKRVVRKWRSSTMPEAGFKYGWMPPHPSFYVRREVADTVGQFDVQYRVAADYDWMMRCCQTQRKPV